MSVMLRNNAASARALGGVRSGGGGGGSTKGVRRGAPIKRKVDVPEDPAAELMPAAEFLGHETDFAAIMEKLPDSPFDPARRKVLGRLMGMFAMDYQGASPEERRFLKRLLAALNAREGYVANRALHLCGAPQIIRRTLALGVAEARFATRPAQGFLGTVQARIAATTFRLLGPKGREFVWNLLTLAGCDDQGRPLAASDRLLERALILKAVAARRHQLGPWSGSGQRALEEIGRFAVDIRGNGRETLAARTTLVPGDPARQAPRLVTLAAGTERAAYIARGDIDPAFAWLEHGRKCERAGGKKTADPIEEALPDLDRSPLLDRPRLHQALAEARGRNDPALPESLREAVTDYLAGRELGANETARKNEALAILRDKAFDVMRPESIEAIRVDARGVYRFDAARALGDLLSRYTGASYVRRVFSDQLTAGADPLGQITLALERGLSVPISVGELKSQTARAFTATGFRALPDDIALSLVEPVRAAAVDLSGKVLLSPLLPQEFGRRARADAYMAPAALDLYAPPFGIPMPELGIEDRL